MADTRWSAKGPFRIRIIRGLTNEQYIDCLLHEVSHVIDIEVNGDPPGQTHSDCHRDSWGKIYSKIYREYWDWRESIQAKERTCNDSDNT